jgi:signal transduction histidine kinase
MSRPRVLVIEDDEDDFVLASSLLSRSQAPEYSLEWAPTYEEGLEKLRQGSFDACLVDYRLGARDGVTLIAEVQASGVRVPCILLTGEPDPQVDMAGMRAGAADYLHKSTLSAALLERSIRYAVQHRRLEDQRVSLAVEQAAREEAERANRAKDEFLAVLGHELRNPLAAMTNAVGLLGLQGADVKALKLAHDVLHRQIGVMKRLIDDLLDVARMAHGKLAVKRESVDLLETVRSALAVVRPITEERHQTCDVQLPEEVLLVVGDATRLEQVFVNLLQNACKYTDPGGRIAVTLTSSGGFAVISVADTGIGMTPEMLTRAFELFAQQGDASGTESGLGLGLALVRRIVELHEGAVSAESAGPGQGSTFTVRLPLAESASATRRD